MAGSNELQLNVCVTKDARRHDAESTLSKCKGNEMADKVVNEATKNTNIDLAVNLNKTETYFII